MRESAVASEKIAVDRASRRRESRCSTPPSIGRQVAASLSTKAARSFSEPSQSCDEFLIRIGSGWWVGVPHTGDGFSTGGRRCLLRSRAPAVRALSMPNIKQQEKRVRSAARQRLENLRYRSTIKTLTKRLETAVDDGDAERVASERRQLESLIDRAAAHGALHRNTAARKKSQVARIAARS